jgi:molybdenum cofactor cytidylyltransferase
MNVAIILAAGESRRMGRLKQLLPFGGKTMLECVVDAFRSPVVDETIVVLGHRAEEIAGTIGSQGGTSVPPTIVKNPQYRRGMFTSVQAGLRALPKSATLVLIALCDQPRLRRKTIERLVSEFEQGHHKILVPMHGGRQGHPLLFRAVYAKEILAMDESLTLKHFLAAHAEDLGRLPVDDEGVLMDIDDRETYDRESKKSA